MTRLLCCLLVSLCVAMSMQGTDASKTIESKIEYTRDIRPILAKNCFACHGSDESTRKAGLRLDQREATITAGKKRPAAILPGKADESELIKRLLSDDDTERMPPPDAAMKLTSEQISKLKRWINEGANYAQHWAFVTPTKQMVPATKLKDWGKQPLDQYILARLEQVGLKPSPEADKYALIRRLSLDLRGLPPSLVEINTFEKDTSPNAYEKLVDRFLADPTYGERWARVWLDLARYADSAGYGSDPLRLNMWRYRDWVIEAINKNLTYDQFTIQQLAGDLLPNPTLEQKMATAFHRNTMTNTEGGTDREEFRVAAVKDRINTTMQVWMGLTMGCAQCHSHKYDPISHQEYYQAYAIFNQTADNDQPSEAPTMPAPTLTETQKNQEIDAKIAGIRQEMDKPTPELAKAQNEWETGLRSDAPWVMLPQEKAKDGAKVSVRVPHPMLTGLRLETLSGDSKITVSKQAVDAKAPVARFVRITLPGKNLILSLAEVEVFQGNDNLARLGDASQSSLDFKGYASRAIDGNTNGDFFASNSVTHTLTESDPWWEVKLSWDTTVDRIVLWNRIGGVEQRLQGALVQLLDVNHEPFWERKIDEVPMPSLEIDTVSQRINIAKPIVKKNETLVVFKEPVAFNGNELLTIKFDKKSAAKEVRISVTNDTKLAARSALPEATLTVLDLPTKKRTVEQQQQLASYYRTIAPLLKPLRDQIAKLDKSRPAISSLPVMVELPAKDRRITKIMKKGNFLDPGEVVEPALPALFKPGETSNKEPTNRMQLAKWLIHPDNPLTARVAVNRLWAQLFGTGLVETEEDFGTQGDAPSHPELLDYLAWQYQNNLKWDTKAMIKSIVMSATYRQSSKVTPELLEKDPRNRLLSRGPRYRLEAEMVRDQALALSGLLNKKIGGPSVFPRQPDGLWQAAFNGERTWMTSMGNDRFRRGLYTFWRRTIPYPSMAAFDAPSREVCQVKRIRSNTPIQAFVTLNDPVYVEAAQALARRIVKEGGCTTHERLKYALKLCTGRPADERQLAPLMQLYTRELERFRRSPEAAMKLATDPIGTLPAGWKAEELATWTVIANVLLNLDSVLMKG
ncbi:MAG TPA: DUF1553 domain-containing protein [Gemmatales bacterium]|nr:DUF1553 domain-containing protein [Gemmatales bacterium]